MSQSKAPDSILKFMSENTSSFELDKSVNVYSKPFPRETEVRGEEYDISPAHVGPFKGAVDFLVDLGTPTLAPLEGEIVDVVDSNDRYGSTEEFAGYVNYVTIKHPNDELSQVLHLAKGSSKVKVGDMVRTGQELAVSGNSGWMTEPHLHFFVFKNLPGGAFKGLEIQFKK